MAAASPQVAQPVRLLAVQQGDDQGAVPLEGEQRGAVVAAGATAPVQDDRPWRQDPGVDALDTVVDSLVEARDAPRELHPAGATLARCVSRPAADTRPTSSPRRQPPPASAGQPFSCPPRRMR